MKTFLLCLLMLTTAAVAQIPTSGLVAYYPFNGNAYDESGYGNHGSRYDVTLVADRFGRPDKAFSFNGSTSVIDCGNSSSIQTTSVTVNCWIYYTGPRPTVNFPTILTKGQKGINGYALFLGMDLIGVEPSQWGSWQAMYTRDPLFSNTWIMVTFSYDNATHTVTLYRDGVFEATMPYAMAPATTANLEIGHGYNTLGYNGTQGFTGIIDDVRIYNRVLSSLEINALLQETGLQSLPPVADAGMDLNYECSAMTGTAILLDGAGSYDPQNLALSYSWSSGGSIIAGPSSSSSALVYLPVGTHSITLTIENELTLTATDVVHVTVEDNTGPTLGPTTAVRAHTAPGLCYAPGTSVTITPPDADDACSSSISYSHDAPLDFPLGTTIVTWTATDGYGNSTTATQSVTVVDEEAPTITVTLSPTQLWPPNRNMIEISATVNAADNCSVQYSLTSLVSSEADYGLGGGDLPNDIQQALPGSSGSSFYLRAERWAGGTGRVYTATYTAIDGSGNMATSTATVTVPHHLNKSNVAGDMPLDEFVLEQNYPNPFNPSTQISYSLNSATYVRLTVMDVIGSEIAVPVDQIQTPGRYTIPFDAHFLPSGTYFYRLETLDGVQIRSMMLMR